MGGLILIRLARRYRVIPRLRNARRWALAAMLPVAGCASGHVPFNVGRLYGPETASSGATHPGQLGGSSRASAASCPAAGTPDFIQGDDAPTHRPIASRAMRYSIGDRFNIFVAGYEDISGDYLVNADGRITRRSPANSPSWG